MVDTPPTRNAIDFLEAPERMADFFSSRLLRWLITPYRSRWVNAASRPFYHLADRILGSQFLEDIAQFFILFSTMYDGFVERARAVSRTLEDRRTTFVVVTTLEEAPVREAEFFMDALSSRGFHLGAVVLNKVLPPYFVQPGATAVAEELCRRSAEVAEEVVAGLAGLEARARAGAEAGTGAGTVGAGPAGGTGAALGPPDRLGRVLREVGESFLNYRVVASREAEQLGELSCPPELVATAPVLDGDVADLAGLLRVGRAIWTPWIQP